LGVLLVVFGISSPRSPSWWSFSRAGRLLKKIETSMDCTFWAPCSGSCLSGTGQNEKRIVKNNSQNPCGGRLWEKLLFWAVSGDSGEKHPFRGGWMTRGRPLWYPWSKICERGDRNWTFAGADLSGDSPAAPRTHSEGEIVILGCVRWLRWKTPFSGGLDDSRAPPVVSMKQNLWKGWQKLNIRGCRFVGRLACSPEDPFWVREKLLFWAVSGDSGEKHPFRGGWMTRGRPLWYPWSKICERGDRNWTFAGADLSGDSPAAPRTHSESKRVLKRKGRPANSKARVVCNA